MRITVRAKPGARKEFVEKETGVPAGLFEKRPSGNAGALPAQFTVAVKEPAVDGRANRAIERALAAYFKVAPSAVRIVAGHSAKQKIFEVSK